MTIKQYGGVFGRNPTFNDVTVTDLNVSTLTATTVNTSTLTTTAAIIDNYVDIKSAGTVRGNIYADASNMYINTQGTNTNLNANGGNVILGNANLVINTAGKGIDFSATAGTGTSELLDDYEEGTWQPVYTSTTNAADNVNNSRVGYYTKVGNMVYATAYLIGNDLSGITSTDQVRIGGLPFASSSTSGGNDQAVNVAQYRFLLTTDHTLLVPNASSYVAVTTNGFSGATYATFFQYLSSTATSLKISMVYQAQ
tara:strand:- start:1788 stop:2549 length:762 start_codon:yes stop_codon:yes gene_type:complete